jgi:hypothetical protein
MRGVAIYMEGGGDSAAGKAALRQGMDVFLTVLKVAVRAKSLRWKLVCCGGRNQAFDAFQNASRDEEMAIVILLVDAEGPVTSTSSAHLTTRDGWALAGVANDVLHLMIQTMEAWIVADPDALTGYYGQHFHPNALPKALNLETVAKVDITKGLDRATRDTQKGTYHKGRHASDLLKLIDVQKVRQRCPNCERLFVQVSAAVAGL